MTDTETFGAPTAMVSSASGYCVSGRSSMLIHLLRCAEGGAEAADWLACAQALLVCGEDGSAALFFDVADLRTGMSPMWRNAQTRRQGGGRVRAERPDVPPASATGVEGAIAELTRLVSLLPPDSDIFPRPLSPPVLESPSGAEPLPTLVDDWAKLSRALAVAMRHAVCDVDEMSRLLVQLEAALASRARFVAGRHVDLPLASIAAGIALGGVREWFASIRHLAFPPFGSPAMLHAAARFDDATLGPYFSRLQSLVSTQREVVALAQLAAVAAAAPGTASQRLAGLFGAALNGSRQLELVDLFADRGERAALRVIGYAVANRSSWHRDEAMLWRCRDVALDLGDTQLAVEMQRQIAATAPSSATEFTVLGELAAGAGAADEAEAAFVHSLRLEPDGRAAHERLWALRRGRFAPFLIGQGFGSSPKRARLRREYASSAANRPARPTQTSTADETPLQRYRAWMVEQALPLWASRGFDGKAKRFRERLDVAAAPLDVPHRALVQARQIYVFAHAARLDWFDGGALAEAAMQSLLRDFGDGTRGVSFSVDARGAVASETRDAYTHAFALFAAAHLYRLNGDPGLLAFAERMIAFIDKRLSDRSAGGLLDRLPGPSGEKSQNPHMHLLEAYLALEEAAPGRGYLTRAAALVSLFKSRMTDPVSGAVLEFFAPDWSRLDDPARNAVIEPGHQFEWTWLLREYHVLSGERQEACMARLYDVGLRGVTSDGLVWDALDGDLAVAKRSHRLWPHTEAIKAAAARHAGGDPAAAPFAQRLADTLARDFLAGPFPGGWIDQIDERRRPTVDYVPASSLYHLFLAAAEADATFGRADDGEMIRAAAPCADSSDRSLGAA